MGGVLWNSLKPTPSWILPHMLSWLLLDAAARPAGLSLLRRHSEHPWVTPVCGGHGYHERRSHCEGGLAAQTRSVPALQERGWAWVCPALGCRTWGRGYTAPAGNFVAISKSTCCVQACSRVAPPHHGALGLPQEECAGPAFPIVWRSWPPPGASWPEAEALCRACFERLGGGADCFNLIPGFPGRQQGHGCCSRAGRLVAWALPKGS